MLKLNLARIPDARTCLLVLCRRDFAWAREGKGSGRSMARAGKLARMMDDSHKLCSKTNPFYPKLKHFIQKICNKI